MYFQMHSTKYQFHPTGRTSTGLDAKKTTEKCPEILYLKVSNKMTYANSADPDQSLHYLLFH